MNKHIKESDIIPKAITVMVSFDQLRHGSEYPGGSVNSRKAYRDQDIEQLAHSLLPQNDGQLKPLLCCTHPSKPNLFFVFDGGRREAAFDFAINKKALLPKGHPIEIKDFGQISPELALQLSWAANEQVPLHPADRAEAFAKLVASKTPEQIAEERGMSLQSVKQSIALGTALAPEAIALWRADKIRRQDVEVLVLGDVEQQQGILKDFEDSFVSRHGGGLDLREVRRKLMKNKEPEMRRLLGFVGVENYRRAGGIVVEDFFGEGGNVKDMKLLKKLAKDAMEIIRRELEHAGWSWTELLLTETHMHHGHSQLQVKAKPSTEQTKRLVAIKARLDAIEKQDPDGEDEKLGEEVEMLEDERDRINKLVAFQSYTPEQKKKSGVIVSLNKDGGVVYQGGLIRKAEPKLKGAAKTALEGLTAKQPAPRVPDISPEVDDALDEIKRKAVQKLLSAKPREAMALFLAATTQGMYGAIEWDQVGDNDDIAPRARNLSSAFDQLKKLPVDKLVAKLAAATARVSHLDGSSDSLVIIEAIGEKALQAEFAKAFDAKAYAAGATKAHLLGIIAETRGETERKTLEKADEKQLRIQAAEACKLTGWLPPQLRTKAYAGPTVKKPAKVKAKVAAKKGGKKK